MIPTTQTPRKRATRRNDIKSLVGRKFHKLTVLSYAIGPWVKPHWLCLCECGREKIIKGTALLYSNTKSCGCLRIEQMKKARLVRVYKERKPRKPYVKKGPAPPKAAKEPTLAAPTPPPAPLTPEAELERRLRLRKEIIAAGLKAGHRRADILELAGLPAETTTAELRAMI